MYMKTKRIFEGTSTIDFSHTTPVGFVLQRF